MRKKIKFYKLLLIELVETLCSICLYLEADSRRSHNHYGVYMPSHFNELKRFSKELRGERSDKKEYM